MKRESAVPRERERDRTGPMAIVYSCVHTVLVATAFFIVFTYVYSCTVCTPIQDHRTDQGQASAIPDSGIALYAHTVTPECE